MTGASDLSSHEILVRLLDATPLPTPGEDVERLLETFEAVLERRAAILALLGPSLRLTDADRPLLVELERRHALWEDALAAARRAIGGQRVSTAQLRAYARTI